MRSPTTFQPLAAPLSYATPLGRKRTRDFELPPRIYRRGERYYYVTHVGKWISLGSDLARAKRRWSDLECLGFAGSVADLCERHIADHMAKRAASTKRQYRSMARMIAVQFPFPAEDLRTVHISLWRDRPETGKAWANGVISLLRVAYAKGLDLGYVTHNPAAAAQFNETSVRERYLTDQEFLAIRSKASAWLRSAMMLSYFTAMRPVDILSLRWDEVGETLTKRTQKTAVRLAFTLTTEITSTLTEARARPILGLYVVADARGKPISYRRLNKYWHLACKAAGVSDAQFRDIRAKAATDAEADGQDYQRLLGHSTRRMSERYIKGRRTIRVEPLRRNIG